MRILITTLAILLIGATAMAQPACGLCDGPCRLDGRHAGQGHGGGFLAGPGPHGKEHMEHWRQANRPDEMIEAFRLYKLTEYLELSEEQTAQVYPRLAEMKKLRFEHQELMQAKFEELRELLDDEKPKADKAAKLAREIQAEKTRMRAKVQQMEDALIGTLEPLQQAKFVAFQHKFREHLQQAGRRLGRIHEGHGPMHDDDAPSPPRKGPRRG